MAAWWIDWIGSGLTGVSADLPKALFRVVFALGCLLKIAVETRRGSFSYFDYQTFPYFLHRLQHRRFPLAPVVYRIFYLLQFVAAVGLLAGSRPRFFFALLAISIAVRSAAEMKNNSSLAILFAAAFALSPDGGQTLSLASLIAHRGDVSAWYGESVATLSSNFGRGLGVITMSVAYVATAIRKMNVVFLSGASVYANLQLTQRERERRYFPDGWYPAWFLRRFVEADEATLHRRWKPFMGLTVALELALPFALLTPSGAPVAVLLGIALHTGFALVNPSAIAHFSIFSVGSYLLFVDDGLVIRLTHGWIR